MNNIIANIQSIREKKKIPQHELAKKIGLNQPALSLILSGARALKYETLERIAAAYNMSVIDIITYPDKYYRGIQTTTGEDGIIEITLLNENILTVKYKITQKSELDVKKSTKDSIG